MSAPRWERVKALFQAALEREPSARHDFLRDACDDPDTRAEVESLLASHDAADEFLEEPPGEAAAALLATQDADPMIGRHLGPYRVLRRIGRGGTGSVWLAVRDDDEYQKRVAIKVIRRGMATEDMLRRFRSERQILASIDHPNIARLLDGGSTEQGLPYFVMEYIDGDPVHRYCDLHHLSVVDRLELVRTVCSAVQVAHQNLVVHRDLKPGNILVTADGVPKLLDFGIAKLLNPDLSVDTTEPTVLELRVMTPEYASPEQVRGQVITTASDVYSLGVLLYELLCGRRPYEVSHLRLGEMERVVCEQEPRPPSAVVGIAADERQRDGTLRHVDPAQVARERGTSPERLRRQLADDLDNIVLKTLRKEPRRRYASAEQLSEDIRRYLQGLPVGARADTIGYRARKFVRRHRLPVSLAASTFLFVSLLAATLLVQSRRVAAERDRAEAAAARATVVNDFLQRMLGAPDPVEGIGRDVTVIESLEAAVVRVGPAFAEQPDIEAAIRHSIGRTFGRLGRYREAEQQLARALELRRELYPDGHVDVAASLNALGEVRYDLGEADEAERLYRQALDLWVRLVGPAHRDIAAALDNLGNVAHDRGDLEAAEALYRRGLEMRRELLGPGHQDVAGSINNIASIHHDRGDLAAAEGLYRESLTLARAALGDEHPDVASSLSNLAYLLEDQGRMDEAEPIHREAVRMSRRLLGDRHPAVIFGLGNLAFFVTERGEVDEARRLLDEQLELARAAWGDDEDTAYVIADRGRFELDQQTPDRAEFLLGEAVAMFRRHVEEDSAALADAAFDHGRALAELRRYAEAEPLMLQGLQQARDELGDDSEVVAAMAARVVELYETWGQPRRADPYRSLVAEQGAGSGGTP